MQQFRSSQVCVSLVILTGLFTFRVLAEIIERLFAGIWTTNYSGWSSVAIDYPLLFASQVVVLSSMLIGIRKVATLNWPPGYSLSIRIFAKIYFITMLIRFVVALSGASDLYWFQLPLPAFFHLVIAAYLYGFAYHLELNRLEPEAMV